MISPVKTATEREDRESDESSDIDKDVNVEDLNFNVLPSEDQNVGEESAKENVEEEDGDKKHPRDYQNINSAPDKILTMIMVAGG